MVKKTSKVLIKKKKKKSSSMKIDKGEFSSKIFKSNFFSRGYSFKELKVGFLY